MVYELKPLDKQQKSFYGKACVVIDEENSTLTLYSYGTAIMRIYSNGYIERVWPTASSKWSATTGRHIKAFSGLNKRDFFALPKYAEGGDEQ